MFELFNVICQLPLNLRPDREEFPHLSESVLNGSVLVLQRPLHQVLHSRGLGNRECLQWYFIMNLKHQYWSQLTFPVVLTSFSWAITIWRSLCPDPMDLILTPLRLKALLALSILIVNHSSLSLSTNQLYLLFWVNSKVQSSHHYCNIAKIIQLRLRKFHLHNLSGLKWANLTALHFLVIVKKVLELE